MNLDWLAGFFDGEGSVSCVLKGDRANVCVSIPQKNKKPLEEILERFPGGSLYSQDTRKYSVWQLEYRNQACLDILAALKDRVSLKKVQVEAGLYLAAFTQEGGIGYSPLDEETKRIRLTLAQIIKEANGKVWIPPNAESSA